MRSFPCLLPATLPDGSTGVLAPRQWTGVIEFARARDASVHPLGRPSGGRCQPLPGESGCRKPRPQLPLDSAHRDGLHPLRRSAAAGLWRHGARGPRADPGPRAGRPRGRSLRHRRLARRLARRALPDRGMAPRLLRGGGALQLRGPGHRARPLRRGARARAGVPGVCPRAVCTSGLHPAPRRPAQPLAPLPAHAWRLAGGDLGAPGGAGRSPCAGGGAPRAGPGHVPGGRSGRRPGVLPGAALPRQGARRGHRGGPTGRAPHRGGGQGAPAGRPARLGRGPGAGAGRAPRSQGRRGGIWGPSGGPSPAAEPCWCRSAGRSPSGW